MHYRRLLALLFWCMLHGRFVLEAQEIPFRLYTPHDGLPQSQITAVFQDSRGYLWVGTHNGLAYFDGVQFTALQAKDGLPASHVRQIQEDAVGNIVFNAGGWLCWYDGRQVTYQKTPFLFFGGRFCIDAQKTMWAVDQADGQLYYSTDYRQWIPATRMCSALQNHTWLNICVDTRNNRLLLSSADAFFALQNNVLHQLYGLKIISNAIGSTGYGGFGTERDSLFEIEINRCKPVYFKKGMSHGLKNRRGQLFFVTKQDEKLYWMDASNNLDSLSVGASINFLFLDRADNLWVATEKGLARIFSEGFLNFKKNVLDGIWSMVEDADGNMWFGAYYSHQLTRYDGRKFMPVKIGYRIHPELTKGDLGDFYFGGSRDAAGNLYFSSKYGIRKYDGRRFSFVGQPPQGKELSLYFYLDTLRNRIVSGTYGGVNVIDLHSGLTRFYGVQHGLQESGNALGITRDKQGDYWISMGKGIAVLNPEKGCYTRNYYPDLHNFPYTNTLCILNDHQGNIWAGSAKALIWHDAQRDTFVEIAPDIIRTTVNSLVVLGNRHLIIGAGDGIYFLDLKAFYHDHTTVVRHFNQHNGYMGIEPNQNCAYADSRGNIWISASDMVTRITPARLNRKPVTLQLYFTEINNERIAYRQYGQVIALPAGVNTAKIRFQAVGFERLADTEFSYQTNDSEWSPWRSEDFAILDNLSSGIYHFQVRTRPSGTVETAEIGQASIRIAVDAAFWKENWFPWVAACAFFSIFSGFLLYAARARRREQDHRDYIKRQKEQEQERIRQNKYLQIQTLQAQLNPHFIFNVLQAVQTRIYEGNRDAASSLIVELGYLIRRFLDSSVNMGLSKGRSSEISIRQEVDLLNSYIAFEQLQYSNRFDFAIHVDEELDMENIYVPPMLIQPYVENAIKHGILYEKEKRCRLDVHFVKKNGDQLLCRISDNGVGRKKAREIQQQFIRMYRSRGTEILEERIRIMQETGQGIQVHVHDRPEGGTVVTLLIDI